MSRVGAGLVGIDPSGTTRAAPRAHPDRAAGERAPRARRHAGRLRPHLDRAGRAPPRPAAARVRRRAAAARLRTRRGAGPRPAAARWSAGSRWTRPSSTSATTDGAAGRAGDRLRPGRRRRADRRRLGRLGRHDRARDRHRASAPGSHRHGRRVPACGAVAMSDPRRRHRRRAELRARGLAGLGGRRWPAALRPGAYDVVRLTIGRDGTWRDARAAADRAGRGGRGAARLRRRVPGAARTARRGRHAGGALRPRRRAVRRLGGAAPARWRWTSGPPSWSRDAVGHRDRRRACCSRAATAPTYAWTHPVVVKPVAAGSSHGVLAGPARADELRAALAAALALDDRVLVEDVVVGPRDRRRRARPARRQPRRARPPWRSWSTASSTTTTSTTAAPSSGCPPPLADAERKALEDAALAMYDALGCCGRRPGRLLPHRRRAGAQRGQHDAGLHRAVAGAARCSRPPGCRTPTCSTCWCATRSSPSDIVRDTAREHPDRGAGPAARARRSGW